LSSFAEILIEMSIIEIEAYESLVKEFGQEKAKLILTALQTLFAKQDYVTKDYLEESLAKLESHTDTQIAELKAHTGTQIAELKANTNTQIAELKANTNTQIAELKNYVDEKINKSQNYILKWMFGMWFSLIVFILASIFLKH